MQGARRGALFRGLRLGSAFSLSSCLALGLLLAGDPSAAGGSVLGFALFALNGFLLVETARSVAAGAGTPKRAVALSAIGRHMLISAGLAGIFLLLGRSAGLGACGGLFLSQVHLHFPLRRTGVEV